MKNIFVSIIWVTTILLPRIVSAQYDGVWGTSPGSFSSPTFEVENGNVTFYYAEAGGYDRCNQMAYYGPTLIDNGSFYFSGTTKDLAFNVWGYFTSSTQCSGVVYFTCDYINTYSNNWIVSKRLSSNLTPTNLVLSNTYVTENMPIATTVGSFSTQDPDVGDTFAYVLTNGTGGTDNGSFTISGTNLLTAAIFNYEIKSNYSIRVQSSDQGGLSTQANFSINILDIDEPAPSFADAPIMSDGNMVIRWGSLSNKQYTIHYSTNLLSGFTALQSNIPATPSMNSYTDSLATFTQKYWKVTTDE